MSDPITRLTAALEGRYAIEREFGEGGMATVYLADDLKDELPGQIPRRRCGLSRDQRGAGASVEGSIEPVILP